jgi:hypothetical protein
MRNKRTKKLKEQKRELKLFIIIRLNIKEPCSPLNINQNNKLEAIEDLKILVVYIGIIFFTIFFDFSLFFMSFCALTEEKLNLNKKKTNVTFDIKSGIIK